MENKGKGSELQKKYLRLFFSSVLIIGLTVAFSLFFLYSQIRIKETTEYTVSQLEQICASTDILYESMEAVVHEVMTDADTATFFFNQSVDRLKEAAAGIRIRSIRSGNPYLRHITLYNSTNRRFVSSSCAGDGNALKAEDFYTRLAEKPYVCFYRQTGAEFTIQPNRTVPVFTFVFPIRMKADHTTDLAIIDVNETYFSRVLSPMRTESMRQQVVLLDQDNEFITSLSADPDQNGFAHNTNPPTFHGGELDFLHDGSGSVRSKQEGEDQFIAFSQAGNAGWTILNILPYRTIYSGFGKIALITFSVILFVLILGYALSKKLSSFLYIPIHDLYENYVSTDIKKKKGNELNLLNEAFSEMYSRVDSLEQGLITSFQESRSLYLRYMLYGEINKVTASAQAYQKLGIRLDSPYFSVSMLECVPCDEKKLESEKPNLFIYYYALENIVRELLSPLGEAEFLREGETRFVVLLYLKNSSLPQELYESFSVAIYTMLEEFNAITAVCVGDITDSWQNINVLYEQTRIALDSKSAGHSGSVFSYTESSETISNEVYYSSVCTRLSDYVRSQNMAACGEIFDKTLSMLSSVSFRDVKSWSRHTLMSVLDGFSIAFSQEDVAFSELINQLGEINNCQNIAALRWVFLDFLGSLARQLSINRKNSNQDAALRVKAYIDRNYSDPNLSLAILADKVQLSPGYLGRTFSLATAFSITDYINKVRMEAASELLLTTKMPIHQISEQVGVLNTNYFYSLFRKHFGVTPTAYRKNDKANQREKEIRE